MCLDVPDLVERRLEAGYIRGFEFEINHDTRGQRCGYLRVLPGHPWFEVPAESIGASVHGGLTFSDYGTECPTHGSAAEWWVGFDCAHGGDLADPTLPIKEVSIYESNARLAEIYKDAPYAGVRTQEYVRQHVQNLADQALAAQKDSLRA